MPDATRDEPVCISARELLGVGAAVGVRRAVGIAFEGDGGHGDDGKFGELPFYRVVFRLALGQAEPPAVIVDRNRDMVGVIEGSRAAIELGVVEITFR